MKNHGKILVIGAGAIGTYVGGSLALRGHQVVFLERPRNINQIRNHGLSLKIQGKDLQVPDPVIASSMGSALQKGPFNFAIYALKSFDTEPFIKTILPFTDALPPFLCLSNGVYNEEILVKALGQERVIPGTVTSAVSRKDVGRITLERLRGIGVAADHPLSESISIMMNQAGLNPRLFSCPASMKWSKLLINLISNASSAILNMPPGQVYGHPGLYWIETMQLLETLTVMHSQRIKTVNLPGTPVQLLAFVVRFLPRKISQPLLKKVVMGGRGDKMPSFYLDLQRGRGKSEINYLNGAVVHAGQKNDIATPVNEFLTQTLMGIISGEINKEEYQQQPEKLVAQLIERLPNG